MNTQRWTRLASIGFFILFFSLPTFGESLEKLKTDLRSPDEATRVEAAQKLGELKDPTAVELLFVALANNSPAVRIAAIKALAVIGDPRIFTPLVHALSDDNANVREYAESSLAGSDDPRKTEPLISALKDRDFQAQTVALRILTKSSDPAVIHTLESLLRSDTAVSAELRMMLLAIATDQKLVGAYARSSKGEPLIKAARLRLADLQGFQDLPPEHKVIAGKIASLLFVPEIVARYGDLRLDYEVSSIEQKHSEYSGGRIALLPGGIEVDRGPGYTQRTNREFTVSISITDRAGTRISRRAFCHLVPRQIQQENMFFDEVCQDLLKGLESESLKRIAETGDGDLGQIARSLVTGQ